MNNIYLTGMMGCGKTYLGRMLAETLGRRFVDADEWIENAEKRSIAKIFEDKGEPYFRKIEKRTLAEISHIDNLIVACGGGIVLDRENVERMKETGLIVYIERSLDDILQDINTHHRPLLQGGKERLRDIYRERQPIYEKDCDFRVRNDADAQTVIRSIQKILL